MSKDKAEEKARQYAMNKYGGEFVFNEPYIDTLGDYKKGYAQAVADISTENAQLREALREMVDQIDEIGVNRAVDYANGSRYYRCMISDESYEKAKQLLTEIQK